MTVIMRAASKPRNKLERVVFSKQSSAYRKKLATNIAVISELLGENRRQKTEGKMTRITKKFVKGFLVSFISVICLKKWKLKAQKKNPIIAKLKLEMRMSNAEFGKIQQSNFS